jgi:hypothetical protein
MAELLGQLPMKCSCSMESILRKLLLVRISVMSQRILSKSVCKFMKKIEWGGKKLFSIDYFERASQNLL